ncbi:hypothetical protein INR49_024600 [Caranx melampygus]|nr:hypothetical protein INR49_024600 [Caranx melampygus]
MAQRRGQEQHRQQEASRVDRERQLLASLRDQESSERRRHLRQIQELKEREMESALLKEWEVRVKFDLQAEEEKINREKQREQEERMAKELARINMRSKRREMRQYIKETELRELESKLKSAYLNKERAAQIAEHEALRLETRREEARLIS